MVYRRPNLPARIFMKQEIDKKDLLCLKFKHKLFYEAKSSKKYLSEALKPVIYGLSVM